MESIPNDGAAKSGAAPTFDTLYADVAPALYAWAELRIRPQLRARLDPQDLVQEVWMRGIKNFARWDARESSFRMWIFKIGKNVMLEALRALRTEHAAQPGWSPTTKMLALDGVPQSVTSFTQRLAREDAIKEFLAHANELEEQDRMILIHCGLEEETCAEVGTKLGLSEDATIKRWQRLRGKLRERPYAQQLLSDRG
ncbi:MAG: sigma-70 family RNA polymerase sigma factor [Planctomycetes bacterium]|nr:sigma-70 family RNA polymerase sigma factor [Planctomycetota bacterium]